MKKFLSLILSVGVAISLVACGAPANSDTTTSTEETKLEANKTDKNIVQQIKEKGYLSVVTSPDYPPYEFKIIDGGKEKTVGFDIAISEEIAKDLGVELKLIEIGFDGVLLELDNGNADLAVAGFTPSEERAKSVDFSDIYYAATQSVLVRAEDAEKYKTVESLDGKKVGAQITSVQEQMAKAQIPNANITSLSKLPNIIMELNSGNIDAAVIETPVAEGYVRQFPSLAISEIKIIDEAGGSAVAIKKGNEELVQSVNKTIERLKNEGLIDKFVMEANELVGQ